MSACPTIQNLVDAAALRDAEAPALLAPARSTLAYGDLSRQVTATVAALRQANVGRRDRVAVVLPNGPEAAAAMIAVSSGAVCAPLNPGYGADEFRNALRDLGAMALVVPAEEQGPVRTVANELRVRCLDLRWEREWPAGRFVLSGGGGAGGSADDAVGADDVALVLLTSGTTARPKRVPLTHANLTASARDISATLALTPRDCCLNVMPLFHIHGIAGALLATVAGGARIVCTPGFQAPVFLDWLEAFQPTWYTAVPAMHQSILARAAGRRAAVACRLRFIRSSSSALPPSVMAALEAAFAAPVIEAYGMTEAAHQIASNPLPPRARKPGSVGPAVGTEVAVLDAKGAALPPGAVGEIAIRGANVTPGYEANPHPGAAGVVGDWLRTGDEGYVDDDGYLFLSGRLKEIINRGGEKISPREVEEVLLAHPQVAQAVTFAVPDPRLGEDVGAVIVVKSGAVVTATELREFAAARLAAFKIPRVVIFRDEIPGGPTGKPQRAGLAKTLGIDETTAFPERTPAEFVAPRTGTEEIVAKLWQDVLRLPRIGVHDHFVDLGGDSMLAAEIVLRVADALGRDLPLAQFLEHPTIAQCADALDRMPRFAARPRPSRRSAAMRGEQLPLASVQRRFWFLHHLEPGGTAWNRPVLMRLTGPLDTAAVEQALAALVRRHEALRTVFRAQDGVPYQLPLPPGPVPLARCATHELAAEARRPFDLARGPLLRAALARVDSHQHLLLLATHHIVFDDASERIVLRDFAALYGQFAGGLAAGLPELAVQIADLALREREPDAIAEREVALPYWRARLAGIAVAELPTDVARPRAQTYAGARLTRALPAGLSSALRALARQEGVTLYTTMLALFQALLGRHTGETEITVGSPIRARRGSDAQHLIGALVNTLVLRTSLDGDPTVSELMARARATVLGAIAHQQLPFERLVEALAPPRDWSRTPLYQVLFQLRDAGGRTAEAAGLRLETESLDLGVATSDLAVEIIDAGSGLSCVCKYNTDLFARDTIGRLLERYETLLAEAVKDPSRKVSLLAMLGDDERPVIRRASATIVGAPGDGAHH